MPSVGVEPGREDAGVAALLSREHDRAGAVAEQDAGRPVLPVEDSAERLRADHQSVIGHAALQHIVGDRQRVEEAGADRLDVEGDAIVDAECGLDQGRARREGLVGGRRGEHDQADLLGLDPGRGERLPRCLGRQRRRRLAVGGDVARFDAGPLDDPFVGRLDPLGELGIGHAPQRQRRSGAR